MKRAIVLFDLDGTLVDSAPAIYESFCMAFRAMGRQEPDRKSVLDCIGHTLENIFLTLGADKDNVEEFIEHYRTHYRSVMLEGTQLLDGAKDAIECASSFAHLGIVTTKHSKSSQVLLEHLGVWRYFDNIIGVDSVTHPKPHAEPILKALQILNPDSRIDSKYIFMIGDTSLDIRAAKSAKIQAIGVLCGFGKRDDLLSYDIPLCADTREAVELVKTNIAKSDAKGLTTTASNIKI